MLRLPVILEALVFRMISSKLQANWWLLSFAVNIGNFFAQTRTFWFRLEYSSALFLLSGLPVPNSCLQISESRGLMRTKRRLTRTNYKNKNPQRAD